MLAPIGARVRRGASTNVQHTYYFTASGKNRILYEKDIIDLLISRMMFVLTPLIVFATLLLLFVLERLFPLRKNTRALVGRLLVNFSISALAFLVAALLVRPTAQATLHWANVKTFGVIHLLPL